jgi:hypothetical protein
MGASTYAADDISPSTTAPAWSQDSAGNEMATEYISPQEVACPANGIACFINANSKPAEEVR